MSIERAAFDFIDRARDLKDPSEILTGLQAESQKLGFEHFLITGLPLQMQELAPLVMLNAWPAEWYGRYTDRNYFAVDGVAQWSLQTSRPYLWRDVPAPLAETKGAREVNGEAKEHGFVDGYVVPMYSARHWQTAVAFAASEVSEASDRELSALQIMGIFATDAVRQLLEPTRSRKPVLSPRERECLSWAAVGKTSWDISMILGIGHQTVRGYFTSIRAKLDVTTMAHAVSEGIRRREINP